MAEPHHDRVGVPPPKTNSFMMETDSPAKRKRRSQRISGAGKEAGAGSQYTNVVVGSGTPVRTHDSDSEAEGRLLSGAAAITQSRVSKAPPMPYGDDASKSEYNKVSVEDVEVRLRESFVYNMDNRGCTDLRLTIDPRGWFMRRWDVLMILLISYVALITPFEIGFLGPPEGGLLFINRFVDALFVVDLFVNFFLGYFDANGQWEFDNKNIAKHYLFGWFSLDFISVIPFEFIGSTADSDELSQLKIIRLVRLVRLVKLARVIRASRLMKRLEMETEFSYASMTMIKQLTVVMVATHWAACLTHMIVGIEAAEDNWVTTEMEIGTLRYEPIFGLYTAAFFAAVMALPMGVPNFVVPVTIAERIIAILAMLGLGSIYAYVIGNVCDMVQNMDPATNDFQNNMDHLNALLAEVALPRERRQAVREYFHHCKALFRQRFYHELLERMSPQIRGDVALHMHGAWLNEIPFFTCNNKEEQRRFVTAVALALEPLAFPPQELLIHVGEFTENMYIIQRGLVARMGRVLGAGRYVGEDVILHNSRRKYFVRVLTYLDVYAFSKSKMEEILDEGDFESIRKTIRKAAIKLALSRELCRISDQVRLAKMLRNNETQSNVTVDQILAVSGGGDAARGTERVKPHKKKAATPSDFKAMGKRMANVESNMVTTSHKMQAMFLSYRKALLHTHSARSASRQA